MQQIAQRMIAQPFLIGKLIMNKLSINFFLRKRKTCIVYFTVKVNGKSMRERSTGIAVLPENWDERSQTVIGNEEENRTISIIKNGIRATFNKLLAIGIIPSPEYLMKMYLANYNQVGIYEICKKFLAHKEKLNLSKNTLENYKGWVKNLRKYIDKVHEGIDIPVSHYKLAVAEDFFTFLRNKEGDIFNNGKIERPVAHNGAVMHIEFTLGAIKYGIELLEVIKFAPFSNFPKKRKEKSIYNHITQSELKTIEDTKFKSQELQLAADIYKFQCYTGLSYVDVFRFEHEKHLYFDQKHKRYWILLNRQKTGNMSKIPYFKKTKELLKKYDYKLPYIDYQPYNKKLKEIQKICGIKSIPSLTSHTARKFYGDSFLNHPSSPVSMETVSKSMGHSKISTTQKNYTDVALSRMGNEFIKSGEW